MDAKSEIRFFPSPAALRAWFARHHKESRELWVGYYKRGTGRPSVSWPESVDEALCVGWIDGIRKSIDGESYKIRFTPRKRTSTWSAINIKRVGVLKKEGRMQPGGLEAFRCRKENTSGIYSYEQRSENLAPPYDALLKKNKAAWQYFQERPVWYRKAAGWWVVSAKKEETRLKRLGALIECSANGKDIPPLARA
jgi:uncharacterized protein YdeI (YjbR/CyaY-like superfamily)